MKPNRQLQKDVQDELKWEPVLKGCEIGVIAKNGIITLTGIVDDFSKKIAAEEAAKKVLGVKAVAEEIQVKLSKYGIRTDREIAEAILNSLKWKSSVPEDKIKIKVENGWVTLEGEVEWYYQKTFARNCVEALVGVRGISDKITVKPKVNSADIKRNIKKALARNAVLEADDLIVEAADSTVTLKGKVHSIFERSEAAKVAWAAPGVKNVENKLEVI